MNRIYEGREFSNRTVGLRPRCKRLGYDNQPRHRPSRNMATKIPHGKRRNKRRNHNTMAKHSRRQNRK